MVMTRQSSSSSKRKLAELPANDRVSKKPRDDPISNDPRPQPLPAPVEENDKSHFARALDCRHKVGAHVSAAGGVENAVLNAHEIGANAFALFLKSQRKWSSPPLKDTSIACFKRRLEELSYSTKFILPHGSYLINLGNPDKDKRDKSYECFLDDLKRCEQLGLELYNLHPGSTVGDTTREESISLIAGCINQAHRETRIVRVVLENMAGAGNIIGASFADLAAIIKQVEDKQRVGVCLDTCHMFAAGYDIREIDDWNKTMSQFKETIGLEYLCGMHINDSKTPFESKRDRHENIGLGNIGIQAFHHILNDPRVQDIPLILETPTGERPDVWGVEIQMLNRLKEISISELSSAGLVASIRDAATKPGTKTKNIGTRKSKKVDKEQG